MRILNNILLNIGIYVKKKSLFRCGAFILYNSRVRGTFRGMYGWTGKILRIDLTHSSFTVEEPPASLYESYIGGTGLAGHYLRNFITLPYDHPDMPLLLFTGPLVGTKSPASGRMSIMSRSPQTGAVCDASVGGRFGTQIKKAGFDGVIITGASNAWRGVSINDGSVTFADAEAIRGESTSRVAERVNAASTAVVGPAAENGVLFASIVTDGHYCAGRGGLGLVMAAKKLKYIAVNGSGAPGVFDEDELAKAREDIFRLAAASPALKGALGISEFGTGALYDLMHSRRMMPTDNFRATRFEAAPSMNAHEYAQRYQTKKTGCAGCHILCKKRGAGGQLIPEFETMSHFSALIGNSDIDAVVEANRICNEAGMDTISAASTIACHLELTGGSISPAGLVDILNDIAASRGIGVELKAGSYRYAKKLGRPELSMSVKMLELPAYDPRGAYGMALAYATSTRGGCHLRAYPISHEILRKPVATDRFTFSGKARIIKIAEDMNAVIDSLTACKFLFFAASLEEYARAFHGVTGVTATAHDLLRAGERIYYNERAMNAMNGFTATDDDLPPRFFTDSGTGGDGIDVRPIPRGDFLRARSDYYKIRGLDENGMPTEQKCGEIGIPWKRS